MDKSSSNVSTQYIICECGDNFPNETFLKIHLENGHADVETFLCDACPEAFTSLTLLLRHKHTHKTVQPSPKKPNLKTYASKAPMHKPDTMKEKAETMRKKAETTKEKKTPVIKVQNLKRIDSISLIQNINAFKGFIKLEPPTEDESTIVIEAPAMEEAAMELEEVSSPMIVKAESLAAEDLEEEIYYQCDVCNSIFYTEEDFNVHYQSTHALKQEPPTTEQILEQHLKKNHSDQVKVHEVGTAFYYECELVKEERVPAAADKQDKETVNTRESTKICISFQLEKDSLNPTTGAKENAAVTTLNSDNSLNSPVKFKDTHQAININDIKTELLEELGIGTNAESTSLLVEKNDNVKSDLLVETNANVKKKRGGRTKKRRGRPPTVDVFANMPPGLSSAQMSSLARKRKIELKKTRKRLANRRYKLKAREKKKLARIAESSRCKEESVEKIETEILGI